MKLELGVKVTEIAADRVVLSDGREILTRTVVWAGGIQAAAVVGEHRHPDGHGGRIDVAPDLTVDGVPGRLRARRRGQHPRTRRQAVPPAGLGGPAGRQLRGRNILADIDGKPTSPFHYRDKGIMAMIGRERGDRRGRSRTGASSTA